jgi:hypothetical protein
VLSELRDLGDDARTAGVGSVQALELALEGGVDVGLEPCLVELLESSHQGLGHVAAAVGAKAASSRGGGWPGSPGWTGCSSDSLSAQGRIGARGDEIGYGFTGTTTGHQTLAHQHGAAPARA